MAQDPKQNYKHYPRSVSWQVASVLNPSLQNSLPASQQSKHAREKRERSAATGEQSAHSNSCAAASKTWQEEESLPLPPQYVSPGALCKAMPKYMRVKARPDQMHNYANPTTVTTTCSPGNHNNLPFSPHYDFAFGSPRSDHSSAKLTPRSVLDSPKQAIVAIASRRHSPSIRSAATSPMHPRAASRGQVMDLQWNLNSTIAQHPELLQRVVPQMQSAAQGSPLSPANSAVGRESFINNSACNSSPPVALPPTPTTSGRQHQQRRTRNPQPQEPTLETYRKLSPNTYATNTVWNDRRDQDSRNRDQTQPRRTILIKSN